MNPNDKHQWVGKYVTGREKKVLPSSGMPTNAEKQLYRNHRVRKSPFGHHHSNTNNLSIDVKTSGQKFDKKEPIYTNAKYHPINHLLIITQEDSSFTAEKSGGCHLTLKASWYGVLRRAHHLYLFQPKCMTRIKS